MVGLDEAHATHVGSEVVHPLDPSARSEAVGEVTEIERVELAEGEGVGMEMKWNILNLVTDLALGEVLVGLPVDNADPMAWVRGEGVSSRTAATPSAFRRFAR